MRAKLRELATVHRRGLLIGAVGCVLTAAVVLGGVWLASSERFDISRVETVGNQWLPEKALKAHLAVDSPINLFRYDTAAAERRLESSPWVKSATIRREFPDGLRVELSEYQPAAVAIIGDPYLVDEDGVPFKRASAQEAARLGDFIITGVSREAFIRDQEAATRQIAAAIELGRDWPKSGRPDIGEVHFDEVRGFTVVAATGRPSVRLGHGELEVLAERATLFDSLWAALSGEEKAAADFIHLDIAPNPNRVAVAFTPRISPEKEKHQWAN